MKNRFAKRKRDYFLVKDIVLPISLFAAVLVIFYSGITGLAQTTRQEKLESTRQAVTRAVVQCYALEGEYPPSIRYLEDHYGLQVDQDEYVVSYRIFATNIMPDIDVFYREF